MTIDPSDLVASGYEVFYDTFGCAVGVHLTSWPEPWHLLETSHVELALPVSVFRGVMERALDGAIN